MEIKNVKLNHIPAITEAVDENGLGQPLQDEIFSFEVTLADKSVMNVPNDPANAHYWAVKDWYMTHDAKFKFTFEELAEPEFAETIYPPTAEEVEAFLSPEEEEKEEE